MEDIGRICISRCANLPRPSSGPAIVMTRAAGSILPPSSPAIAARPRMMLAAGRRNQVRRPRSRDDPCLSSRVRQPPDEGLLES